MADFYEQKFIVYLEIAQSDLYTEDEKIEAFKKSYEQIEEIKKGGIDYYLRDSDFKKEKEEFQNLCKKYKVIFNLEYDKPTDHFKLKVRHISEDAFIKEIKTCTNKKQLTGKYKKLDNYKNDIVLKKSDSWKILIEKTFEIFGDAKPFIRYIKKNNFPHSDYWTSNSAYYHLALAEGLRNKNTKEEILEYIIKNSGHG